LPAGVGVAVLELELAELAGGAAGVDEELLAVALFDPDAAPPAAAVELAAGWPLAVTVK